MFLSFVSNINNYEIYIQMFKQLLVYWIGLHFGIYKDLLIQSNVNIMNCIELMNNFNYESSYAKIWVHNILRFKSKNQTRDYVPSVWS